MTSPKTFRVTPTFINEGTRALEERFLACSKETARRNLKVLRIDTGLTSKELADVAGISHSLMRAMESGKRSLQIHQAFKIAKGTGVDISSLMASRTLLEWGGDRPYTSSSYHEWLTQGKEPSPGQRELASALLDRKVDQSLELARRHGPYYEGYLAGFLDLVIETFSSDEPQRVDSD